MHNIARQKWHEMPAGWLNRLINFKTDIRVYCATILWTNTVTGAIDRSHVPISCPLLQPADYVNRKGFTLSYCKLYVTIHLHSRTFMLDGRESGSVHDARVFSNSLLGTVLERDPESAWVSYVLLRGFYVLCCVALLYCLLLFKWCFCSLLLVANACHLHRATGIIIIGSKLMTIWHYRNICNVVIGQRSR